MSAWKGSVKSSAAAAMLELIVFTAGAVSAASVEDAYTRRF